MTATAKITWSSADSGDPDCIAEIEIVSVRPDDDKTGTPRGLSEYSLGPWGSIASTWARPVAAPHAP